MATPLTPIELPSPAPLAPPSSHGGVDREAFKTLLAGFASGVTVVTTLHDGERYGMTVAAFSSVSADPPLVLVCLGNQSRPCAPIRASGRFAVTILARDQVTLGKRFAGMIAGVIDRFEGVECTTAVTGAPILPGGLAWLDCEVDQAHVAGDHTIVVGRVLAGGVRDGEALCFWNRSFRPIGPPLP
jgi:flavin reductase (DIM6/NTAB) family NADH-FMN oxidoreductase RutF